METLKVTNVHEAMAKAASQPTPEVLENYSFRIKKSLAKQTNELCKRHGTTMSEFIRQCCEGLVDDYKS